jgi:hypothetical protein
MFVAAVDPNYNGFQLSRGNFYRVPAGRIHIARFTTSFNPAQGRGYYGDTYLRQFIRKWKHEVITKQRRRFEKRMAILCVKSLASDMVREIGEFL